MKGGSNPSRIVLRKISLSDLMPFITRGERKIRCCKDSTKAGLSSLVQGNYKPLSRIKLSLKGGKMKRLNRFVKLMSSVTIVTLVTTATSCENRHGVEATKHNHSDFMMSEKKIEKIHSKLDEVPLADTLTSKKTTLTENPWGLDIKEYVINRTLKVKLDSCTKEIIEFIDGSGKFLYVIEINDPAQSDVSPLRGYVKNQAVINKFVVPGKDKWGAVKRAGINLTNLTKSREKTYRGKPLPAWVIRRLYADNYWSLAFDCPLIDRRTLIEMYPYLGELDKPASEKRKDEHKTALEKPKAKKEQPNEQSLETSKLLQTVPQSDVQLQGDEKPSTLVPKKTP